MIELIPAAKVGKISETDVSLPEKVVSNQEKCVRNMSRGRFAYLYALLKYHLAAAAFGGGVFADADAEFVVGCLLAIERQGVALMGFGYVCYLETTDLMLAIPVEIPEVEHVLDILNGVDMAVDVDIVVFGLDGSHELGCIAHLYSPTLVDRAFLVSYYPIVDGAIVDRENVGRLTALGIDHSPDTSAVSIHLAILTNHAEITRGEVSHGALNPSLDIKLGVHLRHLVHLDSQARQHPRAIDGEQIFHTETTIGRVEIGSIEHVIAQMAHEQSLREIAVERFGQKFVTTYLIHSRAPPKMH